MSKQQIKEKQRVADFGEVFTAEREVRAMCDLVREECERTESRFLEPACGEGAFLIEVLGRKLAQVKKVYGEDLLGFELHAILAISSLYGIDLMLDNAIACRKHLYDLWDDEYTAIAKDQADSACRDAVRFILGKNIVCGDTLTMLLKNGSPIVFPEWTLTKDGLFRRRDYQLSKLLVEEKKNAVPLLPGLVAPADRAPLLPGLTNTPPKTADSSGLVQEYEPVPYTKLHEYA